MRTKRAEPSATPETFHLFVGAAIRRARIDKDWTQAELALAADLSSNYVARLERGEVGPSLFVAHRICEALGTSVDTLCNVHKIAAARSEKTKRRRR